MRTGTRSYTINLGWMAVLLWLLFWLGCFAGFVYAVIHFVIKYW